MPQKEGGKKVKTPNASEGHDEYQAMQQFLHGGLDCISHPSECVTSTADADATALKKWRQDMSGSALAGFQLTMRAGPLCEEPVRGVAEILESAGGGECTIFKIFKISVRYEPSVSQCTCLLRSRRWTAMMTAARRCSLMRAAARRWSSKRTTNTLMSMIQMFILLLDLLMMQLRRRS